MRTSARLYASSILVLFLRELLGPRFVAARPRALDDRDTTAKSTTVRKDADKSTNAGLTERERMLLDRVEQNYPFTALHHIDWDTLRAKLLPAAIDCEERRHGSFSCSLSPDLSAGRCTHSAL